MDAPRVLLWWAGMRRDLPWRHTRDPWAVLVSEVMLQQTQVDRVVPRWHRFLDRFPDVGAGASAGVGAVVQEWAGLGYNRRAVSLHGCATAVVERHDGVFPDDLEGLLGLPGVGPYTARAVLAFAFERDVAVVDTNVGRILARTVGRPLTAAEAQAAADRLVPSGEGWSWNQAVLDLGAMVCTKRDPACSRCPLAEGCTWHRQWSPRSRPCRRVPCRQPGPEPVRRLVPPGSGPAPRCDQSRPTGTAGSVVGVVRLGQWSALNRRGGRPTPTGPPPRSCATAWPR